MNVVILNRISYIHYCTLYNTSSLAEKHSAQMRAAGSVEASRKQFLSRNFGSALYVYY